MFSLCIHSWYELEYSVTSCEMVYLHLYCIGLHQCELQQYTCSLSLSHLWLWFHVSFPSLLLFFSCIMLAIMLYKYGCSITSCAVQWFNRNSDFIDKRASKHRSRQCHGCHAFFSGTRQDVPALANSDFNSIVVEFFRRNYLAWELQDDYFIG